MKSFFYLPFFFLLFACTNPVPQSDITVRKMVVKTIPVADVWAGHPVGFDLLTTEKYQYVAYYDSGRNMCIAQRLLEENQWKIAQLPSKVGWDSHNRVVIADDREGCLHVSGNMHGVPLVYFRSAAPHDIDTFKRLTMIDTNEMRVTYPVFFKNNDGHLYFQYRDGGSGNGITYINRYEVETKTWSRVLEGGLFDGEGETNAYPTNPLKGPDGLFHYMWVWRLNPIANTNHNLSYMRTADFMNFENVRGETIEIPVMYRERRVIADPVGPWNGLMNSSMALSFDSKGRALLGYHKFDKEGFSQLFLARYQNGDWIQRQVSDWTDFTWDINKRGSLKHSIALGDIVADDQGNIFIAYDHEIFGAGLLKVNEENLILTENIPGKQLRVIEGLPNKVNPGLQENLRQDDTGRFLLRWQTQPTNFDRPYTPPTPLLQNWCFMNLSEAGKL